MWRTVRTKSALIMWFQADCNVFGPAGCPAVISWKRAFCQSQTLDTPQSTTVKWFIYKHNDEVRDLIWSVDTDSQKTSERTAARVTKAMVLPVQSSSLKPEVRSYFTALKRLIESTNNRLIICIYMLIEIH